MFFIIQALFTLLGHYYLSALSLMTLTGTSTFLSACLLIENDTIGKILKERQFTLGGLFFERTKSTAKLYTKTYLDLQMFSPEKVFLFR
jgi:hypothetical protein